MSTSSVNGSSIETRTLTPSAAREPLALKRRMRTRKRTQWPWGHYKEAVVWARKSALGVKAAGWLRARLRAPCQPAALRGPRPGHARAGMPAPKSQGGKADGGLARSGNPPAAKRPPTPNALRPDKKAASTCPHGRRTAVHTAGRTRLNNAQGASRKIRS